MFTVLYYTQKCQQSEIYKLTRTSDSEYLNYYTNFPLPQIFQMQMARANSWHTHALGLILWAGFSREGPSLFQILHLWKNALSVVYQIWTFGLLNN